MRHETSGARRVLRIAVATAALLAAGGALAQETPAGRWRTIDDHTGKPSGLVRIDEAAGVFSGVIEQILDPDKPKDSVCDKCTDERKGQPIVGLTILRNLKRSGERYEDGDILDPKNGKVYRCLMKLVDGGRKLEVRGYIGVALLGRTQVWERVE